MWCVIPQIRSQAVLGDYLHDKNGSKLLVALCEVRRRRFADCHTDKKLTRELVITADFCSTMDPEVEDAR